MRAMKYLLPILILLFFLFLTLSRTIIIELFIEDEEAQAVFCQQMEILVYVIKMQSN